MLGDDRRTPAMLVLCAGTMLSGLVPAVAGAQTVGDPLPPVAAIEQPQPDVAKPPVSTPFVVPVGPGGNDSEDIVDTDEDINGIGQIVIGRATCTGTLINPRTVLFAAHCVNTADASVYGYVDGSGAPIGVGFRADNREGFRQWNGEAGNGLFLTNVTEAFYNISQVWWNDLSVAPGAGRDFYEADIALGALDTPARDIPTWALLFSPLPPPGAIDAANGTGYHVTVSGYGLTGAGPGGFAGDVDFRRRTAENMLGILGSLVDWQEFALGQAEGRYLQNLYQIDFDDPARGRPRDTDVFRDDALPNEGITAPGDSGGPLILDRTFDEKVVIAVLSGGSQLNDDQRGASFGTVAFYQPLYLYWDWIAANNPYRYVSAKAGDGRWSDADHWVSLLDPAYRVITADGRLAAGIPGTLGTGPANTAAHKFGQVCKTEGADQYCLDLATRVLFRNGAAVGTVEGDVTTAELIGLPDATIDNGLPGATGFVPNNREKSVIIDFENFTIERIDARYFDVTLSAAGRTELDIDATVDRLTLANVDAMLDVTAGHRLDSLLDINHLAGMVRVNGTLSTPWDYFLMTGVVTGNGTIRASNFTSLAGIIAPGGAGTIGTLSFEGNVVLASGSTLLFDIGRDGASDRIQVSPFTRVVPPLFWWQEETIETVTPGDVSLGGTVRMAPVAGYLPRAGDRFTLLTTTGTLSGAFTAAPLSAILTPEFRYGPNSVQATLVAGDYADVIDPASASQRGYAMLLDASRSSYSALASVYGTLDMLQQQELQLTLDQIVPAAPAASVPLGTAAIDMVSGFFRNRGASLRRGEGGGALAVYGRPVQLASRALSGIDGADTASDMAQPLLLTDEMADDASAYIAGGYLEGDGAVMASPGVGRVAFDGFFLSAGIEKQLGEASYLGFGFSYAELDGDGFATGQQARGRLAQGTLHGAAGLGALRIDAQVSAGAYESDTSRAVTLGGQGYALTASDRAFAFTAEGGISAPIGSDSFSLTPRASLRFAHIGFTPTVERGGQLALRYDIGAIDSLEGRIGATANARLGALRPYIAANFVHAFDDRPDLFGANFAAAPGAIGVFPLAASDRNWGEVSAGVTLGTGRVQLNLAAETTVGRDDLEQRSYRAGLRLAF